MDRISINNLFPYANDFQPLDVHSLYNVKEQKVKNKINFNIDRLINLREERKKKYLSNMKKYLVCALKK